MDLEALAPIMEEIIKETLDERRYKFGFSKYTGISNKVASGTLRNSVRVFTKTEKDVTVLQIMMEEYWQWVQSGRRPGSKGVPTGSLLKWIKDRKLKGRDKLGRFITDKSFAFAIQNNIKKFGIRPSNFLDISIEKMLSDPRITELVGESSFEEVINLIEGI